MTAEGLEMKPSDNDPKTAPRKSREKRRARRPPATNGNGAGAVIHVNFKNGARAQPPVTQPAAAVVRSSEPVTDLFSAREVAKLLGLGGGRLRALDKAGIVSPSGTRGARRAYTFQDLIALRATHGLLTSRVRMRDVADAIGVLKRTLPRVTRPLQELRIVSDGRRVVVRGTEVPFEPLTGQLVLDFQVTSLRDDVVRVLRPEARGACRTAYDLYTRASMLDEDPSTYDEAEALYTRAIHLDPGLAIAYTNLGNLRFRRGDEPAAQRLYRRALEIDPRQPEAHYNIGYVALERGETKDAVVHFDLAIRGDARFADAHFNLAMALEQEGDVSRAKEHWRRYVELEPAGTWAEIARQHL